MVTQKPRRPKPAARKPPERTGILKNHLYITEWMATRGIDDTQMALQLGVKRETFNRYRNHQGRINTITLGEIARALDLEPVELYNPPEFKSLDRMVPDHLRDTAAEMISILIKRS